MSCEPECCRPECFQPETERCLSQSHTEASCVAPTVAYDDAMKDSMRRADPSEHVSDFQVEAPGLSGDPLELSLAKECLCKRLKLTPESDMTRFEVFCLEKYRKNFEHRTADDARISEFWQIHGKEIQEAYHEKLYLEESWASAHCQFRALREYASQQPQEREREEKEREREGGREARRKRAERESYRYPGCVQTPGTLLLLLLRGLFLEGEGERVRA